jgi:hypothetical protein
MPDGNIFGNIRNANGRLGTDWERFGATQRCQESWARLPRGNYESTAVVLLRDFRNGFAGYG